MSALSERRWAVLSVAATLLAGGAAVICGVLAAEPTFAPRADETSTPKLSVDELRKEYPYISLRERLAYEAGRDTPENPTLSDATLERLKQIESTRESSWKVRAESLERLHSEKAAEFVSSPGFGFRRMPVPSPGELPYESKPLPLAEVPPLSADEQFARAVPLPATAAESAEAEARRRGPDGQRLRLPAQDQLLTFHERGEMSFVWPPSLGHVRNRDRVAGFEPHAFTYVPPVDENVPKANEPPPERWLIRRLELVSLLKHEEPVVYVSEHLPRMQELTSDGVRTRPLTHVESNLLGVLHDGEQIAAEATPNRIRMLGALRASKQCLDCHGVKRGALLGAFTYELQRDPPVAVPPVERPSI